MGSLAEAWRQAPPRTRSSPAGDLPAGCLALGGGVNPTLGLALPASGRGGIGSHARPKPQALLAALCPRIAPLGDRPLRRPRRGELKALRWSDVDLDAGLIRVERGWDDKEGPIEPKSRAGRRRVPLAAPLRSILLHTGCEAAPRGGPCLPRPRGGRPLDAEVLSERARRAWGKAGLEPIGLHECRHTYAAFMIAAGVNAKALCSYMGHSTITMTLDRYGHLMPGNEDEAAEMLAAYLERDEQPIPSGLGHSR